jgi:hypothetical protein
MNKVLNTALMVLAIVAAGQSLMVFKLTSVAVKAYMRPTRVPAIVWKG